VSRTERIRTLNDALRTTFRGGRVLVTQGVRSLPLEQNAAVLQAVQAFDTFTPDNDPHEEHDFGSLVLDGRKLYWKIDYYDERMESGSEDPADPERTTRVLTICLAEEY
jgi:hypothetical protein